MLWTLIELMYTMGVKQITALLAAVAAVATVLTLAMPVLSPNVLDKRMKSVALEREKIRQRERERLARGEKEKVALRPSPKQYMQRVVERFNLTKWLAQEEAREKLVQAGYRGQAPYVAFLFFRLITPVVMFVVALFYMFVVLELDQPAMVKFGLCLGAAYAGMQVPYFFLKNRISKRQLSIKRAFPDALDLLLICVESGMSIEAAFKRVSAEIGSQSIALAEELTLTTAELSYLQDRKIGLREPRQAHRSRRREVGLHGAATGRTLRHAARPDVARDVAGKPRHAHVGGREEGRRRCRPSSPCR